MQLRGGAETSDPRLDRVYPGVEAHLPSLRYLSAPLTDGLKPRSFTYGFRTYDPKLDQGQEGACVGFGWGDELACYPKIITGITNQFAREKIYWVAQQIDDWVGGAYPGASPFYEGTSVLAGAKVVCDNLKAMGSYHWAMNLDEMILAVGHLGPVVIGIDWWTGMFRVDADGFIRKTGQVEGGHCILVRGVSLKKRAFLLRNSWGPNWGINGGDCWFSFDDMGASIEAQGEVCVPQQRMLIAA